MFLQLMFILFVKIYKYVYLMRKEKKLKKSVIIFVKMYMEIKCCYGLFVIG